ncbi:hypothetical protein ACHAQJ_005609 [Trichoderma viride]
MSRLFQIVRPAFKHNYQIVPEGEEEPRYKVKSRLYPRNAPDLALHSGPDLTTPILATCYMPNFTRHCKIGFGDPNGTEPLIWEDFVRSKRGSSERNISVSFSGDNIDSETGKGEREQFTWKRTSHVSVPGKKFHSKNGRNRKLIDEQGEVVAIFTSDNKIGNTGWLQINVDRGRDFDVLVMITALAICEKIRRQ